MLVFAAWSVFLQVTRTRITSITVHGEENHQAENCDGLPAAMPRNTKRTQTNKPQTD